MLSPSPPLRAGPPPGWYHDPWRQSIYRWWDGYQWTPAVHPAAAAVPYGYHVVAEPKPPHVSATFPWPGAIGALASTFFAILLATFVGDHLDVGPDWFLVLVIYTVLFGVMAGSTALLGRFFGTSSIRRDFGFSIKAEDIGWGALAFVATIVARVILAIFLSNVVEDPVRDAGGSLELRGAVLLAFAVAAIVGAPIVEELVFRGVLQRSLTKVAGAPVAIVAQGLLFAAYHFVPDGGGYSHFYFGALAVFGIAAGVAVERTGRLGPGMVAHAINNALAIALIAAR